MSDFETVKQAARLEDYAADKLERRGRDYICPACGSGTGRNKTSAFSIKGDSWTCFSCNRHGDVFDLSAYAENIDPEDRVAQLEAVASWANCPIDRTSRNDYRPKPKAATPKRERSEKPAPDYTANRQREAAYIEASAARINAPEAMAYLKDRGFTDSEIRAYRFGYDPTPEHGWQDSAGRWHNGGRIVIPWIGSDFYHIDRALDTDAKDLKYDKPASDKVGPQPLYNPDALQADVFFIVEGALDALAIKVCGYEAVALMGSGNTETEQSIADKAKGAAVVLTDSDEQGDASRARILKLLKDRGRYAVECRIEGHKDAGEWLAADRDALKSFLTGVYESTLSKYQEYKEQAYSDALKRLRVQNPLDVATSLFMGEHYEKPTPTGIKSLDKVLGGGLRSGLYTLGAISSLGKTTLTLQIADSLAKQGRSVLFVTIEQSAAELTAKSLSRYVYTLTGGKREISASRIAGGAASFDLLEQQAIADACEAYGREVSPKLKILEGIEQPKVDDIRKTAEYIANHEGQAPVVFIDYLQLLAPPNERDTDKQATDKNIMLLRQLSRDLKTPVFVISSLNRSSYSEGVTLDSFKESGSIEYGSDCLLGLQPEGLVEAIERAGDKTAKREAAKHHRGHKGGAVRECEIVILKNRNGITPRDGLPITFRAIPSLFEESEKSIQPKVMRI